MIAIRHMFTNASAGMAAVVAAVIVSSCAPIYSPPQQVESKNPSVTYKYQTDQDLIEANQKAATFCTSYQSTPRAASFSTDPDGSKVVVFDCLPMASAAPLPPASPNLTYTYRTDQELLDASRNAQLICMNRGSRQVISNIVTNVDGSKSVTFQCGPA
ncbi:MAG: hypothetical protein IH626_03115 [Rhodospirillales bacterium]|nr:hypothetical protein [Rhodospirillales bacterium]